MKRYAKYKDSGIEWIGEIPEHWEVKPFPYVLSYQEGPGILAKDFRSEGVPLIRISGMQSQKVSLKGCNYLDEKQVETKWKQFKLYSGDLLISASATTGLISEVDKEAEGSIAYTGLIRITPKERLAKNYVKHFLASNIYLTQIDLQKKGSTIQHYGPSHLKNIIIGLPPLTEQTAIAGFLDRKTAELDRLIENKQRLIELYEEERSSLINRAVTRGLDSEVKLKPSGIEWLGDIPEHWEVKRLKYLAKIVDCKNRTPQYFADGKYFVVRTSNVKGTKVVMKDALFTDESNFKEWTKRGVPQAGNVLFTREAPAGEACLVPDNLPLCLGQRMMSFTPEKNILNSKYLLYYIYSNPVIIYINQCSSGSTVSHLRVPQVYDMPIILPSFKEQEDIANHIETKCAYIDGVISKYQKQIDLLQEYRTSLISEAVTGKIDVREELN